VIDRPFPPALHLRDRVLDFAARTHVVGILNVTPDSFSDGGRYLDVEAAIAHGLELAAEGADLIDVGGESTRPGGPPVPAEEEQRRILPVIRGLRARTDVLISVDTTKAAVARAAVLAGADLVNDISALRFDPEMAPSLARLGVPVVLMHSRGGREELHRDPCYGDVLREVAAELGEAMARAAAAGIPEDRVLLDPGIGFSKAAEHNLPLLRDLGPILDRGRPVLVGPSRKSFLGHLTGRPVQERLEATAAAVVAAILAGANLVRVHEVAPLRDAIRVADAIRRGRVGGA
jgi:dihydropteroate synthase